ncbi:hypothetical protein WMY93_031118 [Mugilogobius chulae]|uniref:Uncharacterized protein n=1 Tax=Mugilogobius chulae TaxID=88201 RepID=A0AAW0MJH9_9GOBI
MDWTRCVSGRVARSQGSDGHNGAGCIGGPVEFGQGAENGSMTARASELYDSVCRARVFGEIDTSLRTFASSFREPKTACDTPSDPKNEALNLYTVWLSIRGVLYSEHLIAQPRQPLTLSQAADIVGKVNRGFAIGSVEECLSLLDALQDFCSLMLRYPVVPRLAVDTKECPECLFEADVTADTWREVRRDIACHHFTLRHEFFKSHDIKVNQEKEECDVFRIDGAAEMERAERCAHLLSSDAYECTTSAATDLRAAKFLEQLEQLKMRDEMVKQKTLGKEILYQLKKFAHTLRELEAPRYLSSYPLQFLYRHYGSLNRSRERAKLLSVPYVQFDSDERSAQARLGELVFNLRAAASSASSGRLLSGVCMAMIGPVRRYTRRYNLVAERVTLFKHLIASGFSVDTAYNLVTHVATCECASLIGLPLNQGVELQLKKTWQPTAYNRKLATLTWLFSHLSAYCTLRGLGHGCVRMGDSPEDYNHDGIFVFDQDHASRGQSADLILVDEVGFVNSKVLLSVLPNIAFRGRKQVHITSHVNQTPWLNKVSEIRGDDGEPAYHVVSQSFKCKFHERHPGLMCSCLAIYCPQHISVDTKLRQLMDLVNPRGFESEVTGSTCSQSGDIKSDETTPFEPRVINRFLSNNCLAMDFLVRAPVVRAYFCLDPTFGGGSRSCAGVCGAIELADGKLVNLDELQVDRNDAYLIEHPRLRDQFIPVWNTIVQDFKKWNFGSKVAPVVSSVTQLFTKQSRHKVKSSFGELETTASDNNERIWGGAALSHGPRERQASTFEQHTTAIYQHEVQCCTVTSGQVNTLPHLASTNTQADHCPTTVSFVWENWRPLPTTGANLGGPYCQQNAPCQGTACNEPRQVQPHAFFPVNKMNPKGSPTSAMYRNEVQAFPGFDSLVRKPVSYVNPITRQNERSPSPAPVVWENRAPFSTANAHLHGTYSQQGNEARCKIPTTAVYRKKGQGSGGTNVQAKPRSLVSLTKIQEEHCPNPAPCSLDNVRPFTSAATRLEGSHCQQGPPTTAMYQRAAQEPPGAVHMRNLATRLEGSHCQQGPPTTAMYQRAAQEPPGGSAHAKPRSHVALINSQDERCLTPAPCSLENVRPFPTAAKRLAGSHSQQVYPSTAMYHKGAQAFRGASGQAKLESHVVPVKSQDERCPTPAPFLFENSMLCSTFAAPIDQAPDTGAPCHRPREVTQYAVDRTFQSMTFGLPESALYHQESQALMRPIGQANFASQFVPVDQKQERCLTLGAGVMGSHTPLPSSGVHFTDLNCQQGLGGVGRSGYCTAMMDEPGKGKVIWETAYLVLPLPNDMLKENVLQWLDKLNVASDDAYIFSFLTTGDTFGSLWATIITESGDRDKDECLFWQAKLGLYGAPRLRTLNEVRRDSDLIMLCRFEGLKRRDLQPCVSQKKISRDQATATDDQELREPCLPQKKISRDQATATDDQGLCGAPGPSIINSKKKRTCARSRGEARPTSLEKSQQYLKWTFNGNTKSVNIDFEGRGSIDASCSSAETSVARCPVLRLHGCPRSANAHESCSLLELLVRDPIRDFGPVPLCMAVDCVRIRLSKDDANNEKERLRAGAESEFDRLVADRFAQAKLIKELGLKGARSRVSELRVCGYQSGDKFGSVMYRFASMIDRMFQYFEVKGMRMEPFQLELLRGVVLGITERQLGESLYKYKHTLLDKLGLAPLGSQNCDHTSPVLTHSFILEREFARYANPYTLCLAPRQCGKSMMMRLLLASVLLHLDIDVMVQAQNKHMCTTLRLGVESAMTELQQLPCFRDTEKPLEMCGNPENRIYRFSSCYKGPSFAHFLSSSNDSPAVILAHGLGYFVRCCDQRLESDIRRRYPPHVEVVYKKNTCETIPVKFTILNQSEKRILTREPGNHSSLWDIVSTSHQSVSVNIAGTDVNPFRRSNSFHDAKGRLAVLNALDFMSSSSLFTAYAARGSLEVILGSKSSIFEFDCEFCTGTRVAFKESCKEPIMTFPCCSDGNACVPAMVPDSDSDGVAFKNVMALLRSTSVDELVLLIRVMKEMALSDCAYQDLDIDTFPPKNVENGDITMPFSLMKYVMAFYQGLSEYTDNFVILDKENPCVKLVIESICDNLGKTDEDIPVEIVGQMSFTVIYGGPPSRLYDLVSTTIEQGEDEKNLKFLSTFSQYGFDVLMKNTQFNFAWSGALSFQDWAHHYNS